MPATETVETPKAVRDVRIDQIGFFNELDKQLVKDLKTGVKVRMAEKGIDEASGDFFDAKVVSGEVGTIDPARFFKLYKKQIISEKDFVAAISVVRGRAEDFMSSRDLDAISETKPSSPSLRVTRKKGVEPTLVDALKGLGAAIDNGK